jgi:hypothetical protein
MYVYEYIYIYIYIYMHDAQVMYVYVYISNIYIYIRRIRTPGMFRGLHICMQYIRVQEPGRMRILCVGVGVGVCVRACVRVYTCMCIIYT